MFFQAVYDSRQRQPPGSSRLQAALQSESTHAPQKGKSVCFHSVQITQRRFGPVPIAIAHVRTPNGYEKWSLISDRPTSLKSLDEYALHFDVEENFLDDKSAGFQPESSALRNADALSRLCFGVSHCCSGTSLSCPILTGVADSATSKSGWRYLFMAVRFGKRLLTGLPIFPGECHYLRSDRAMRPSSRARSHSETIVSTQ